MVNDPKESMNADPIGECRMMPVDLINAGKFIEVKDAHDSLLAYLDAPGTPARNDLKHVYGHTFGLNRMQQLLERIQVHNDNLNGEPAIAGVRIYYGISKRDDPAFPLNPPDGMYRDLIFMPVKEDGEDLYPIDNKRFEEDDIILSESRPCPNQCSTFIQKM